MSTGRLAELTSLTTDVITGTIDRLEKAGYTKNWIKIESIFMPLHQRIHKLLSSYSDNELDYLFDVITELIKHIHEESKNLWNR